MSDEVYSIAQLLKDDPRYRLEAYQFMRDALAYGQNMLDMGQPSGGEEGISPGVPPAIDPETADVDPDWEAAEAASESPDQWEPPVEHHLTGQQLCEAIRRYALEQYGYMAKIVLNNWGLHTTGDFGEVVYNLIRIGLMKKSESDIRDDFNDVYDFEDAFQQQFKITLPD